MAPQGGVQLLSQLLPHRIQNISSLFVPAESQMAVGAHQGIQQIGKGWVTV